MTRPHRVEATLLLVLAVLAAVTSSARADDASDPFAGWPAAEVTVASGSALHRFQVWIADTPARRSRGLMFVERLESGRGMLFLFDHPHYATFWMQNTYVALDLLFIAADGTIVNITADAVPLSTWPMESAAPVTGVLEVAAGTAARLGIAPGDRVLHPAFGELAGR